MTAYANDLQATKSLIDQVCKLALLVPLDTARQLAAEIERTDAVMPFLDPTGWQRLSNTLPGHQEEVNAFIAFRARLEALRPEKEQQA